MAKASAATPRRATDIVAFIERRVISGTLPAGERVPTVRALAGELGVSPATVASAYRQLAERGTIVGHGRLGTFVAARPALGTGPPVALPAGVVDLRAGTPDRRLLPPFKPHRSSVDVSYDGPAVHPALAATAARWLDANGLPSGPLAVVGGAMDGIERILQVHLRPGDSVAVEDPGYPYVVDVARALGLAPVAVPVDAGGLAVEPLRAVLPRVQAVVLSARAQNPTGAHLSRARARLLHEAFERHPGLLVIEDDHAGDVAGVPMHSAAAGLERWAVVHSVSKTLGPGLRLALVTGDGDTVERVRGRQRLGTGWVSHVLQTMVAAAYDDPRVAERVARARDTYRMRRDELVAALAAEGVVAFGASGLNVWVPVRDEAETCTALLAAGFAVQPGARFRHRTPPAIRVTVAALPRGAAPAIAAVVARLETAGGRYAS